MGTKHTVNRLNPAFCRTVKRPGKYGDGRGLMLVVKASGAKSWVQRIVIRGKSHDLGLGSFDLVGLADAREAAWNNQKIARAGGDPLALKRVKAAPTLAEAIEAVIELQAASWRDGGRNVQQWRNSLGRHVIPKLGTKRIDAITPGDVLAVLMPLYKDKPDTARRLRQRISAVMKWAIAHEYISNNPAGDAIKVALPKKSVDRKHHKALPYSEIGAAIETIRGSAAQEMAKLALELLILTAARSGEVRKARWDEIDLDAAVWTIPADHTKRNREHRVPLSSRALEVLNAAANMGEDRTGLIFRNTQGRELLSTALNRALIHCGIDAVPHGFRSSFRDWGSERTNTPSAVMEAALAHENRNRVEAAYARSDLFEKRRKLMDAWAAYIGETREAKVVPIHG